LAKSDKPLSLGEIAQFFDIDKSSIFRLLSTLTQNNFVYQDAETKKYMLGFKINGAFRCVFGEQTKIETFLRPVFKSCMRQNQTEYSPCNITWTGGGIHCCLNSRAMG
jgi:DNA-binding IclR family transcriptional regulator